MLEFARGQFLWLFALVALFFVVFFLARRWKRATVTYGFIWQRVARRVRPPAWKRLLRLLLTLLVSSAMLSSAALYAAGLQPAAQNETPPLLLFIVIDNSPSMRAFSYTHSQTRQQMAQARARQLLNSLAPQDRACIVHWQLGRPVAGPFLKRGDAAGPAPRTDYALAQTEELAGCFAAVGLPPHFRPAPEAVRAVWLLTDDPPALKSAEAPARLERVAPAARWKSLGGLPGVVETFGEAGENAGFIEAVFKPSPAGSDDRGLLTARLRGQGKAEALYLAFKWDTMEKDARSFELPLKVPHDLDSDGLDLLVRSERDILTLDDFIRVPLPRSPIRRILILRPKGEEPNPLLREGMELLLPGRRIEEREAVAGEGAESDLVVMDRVAAQPRARALLCFGALPPELGEVEPAREAKAGLFEARAQRPWLGFEVPNLQLLAGREAFPLRPGGGLTPLATHIEAGVLLAASTGERDVLYVGYSPRQSNFLFVPEGPTLLQRWLNALLSRESAWIPPLLPMSQTTEINAGAPMALEVCLDPDVGPGYAYGAESYSVMTGLDGRARLGPLEQPGLYRLLHQGRELARFSAYWVDESEQAAAFVPLPLLDEQALVPAAREPTWVDWFPEILLWVALLGLLLEWLLWLAGITD
ncbi:VWA domain-containing protein [bacterium]|nr:MAG: VWA domain-containing protein [bacterium]RIK64430.1 MAG: hypothetical protein DCC64_04645 [Planctomycetota bacterium]